MWFPPTPTTPPIGADDYLDDSNFPIFKKVTNERAGREHIFYKFPYYLFSSGMGIQYHGSIVPYPVPLSGKMFFGEIALMIPVQGRLVPEGGGDTIELVRPVLVLGRRPSCDIQMEYPNISGQHLRLNFKMGYWTAEDLGSANGIKVNGARVQARTVYPGDILTIGKRNFKLHYDLPRTSTEDDEDMAPTASQAVAPSDTQDGVDLSESLLEKAGISRRRLVKDSPKPEGFDAADFLLDQK